MKSDNLARLTKVFLLRGIHKLSTTDDLDDVWHGHHYKIAVTIEGKIDADSGLCANRDLVDKCVKKTIIKPYDKKNLNTLFEITTGEHLAKRFFDDLKATQIGAYLRCVSIQETNKNKFEYTG